MNLPYRIAGIPFHSRLWACTAQNFRSGARSLPPALAEEVIRVSETDIFITYVPSVRELMAMGDDMCAVDGVPNSVKDKLVQLVCTNLSSTAEEAVEKALRGVRATKARLIKLEVLDDFELIDREVLSATKQLQALGHQDVIPFVSCAAGVAEETLALGVPALRVLASEIGSGRGIDFPKRVRQICGASPVPIIVEGGIGTPEHAVDAIRLGATAVLVNSAIITSADPVKTATSFKAALTENAVRPMATPAA